MANPQPLVSLPELDAFHKASTVSMTNEDPDYTHDFLFDENPATVAKATATTTTITINFDSPQVIVAVALINTNAATASINGGSATTSIPIPGLEHGDYGDRLNPWKRLTSVIPDLTWTVTITRPTENVWIGQIVLAQLLYPLNFRYGLELGVLRPGRNTITSRLGHKWIYDPEIRQRTARGRVGLAEDELLFRRLEASARGQLRPFLFVPDDRVNDAWYVRMRADDFMVTYNDIDQVEIPLAFEELVSGPHQG